MEKNVNDALIFYDNDKDLKNSKEAIVFMDRGINTSERYAILKTTDNGKYVRGNLLFYKFKGIEIYTELNNIIFVDTINNTLFIQEYGNVIDGIAPDNPEERNYIVLYYDLSDNNEDEFPLRWESYSGRTETYESLKLNLSIIDFDKSLVLVDNVALKDALTVRQFIEYINNTNIYQDNIDLSDYEY